MATNPKIIAASRSAKSFDFISKDLSVVKDSESPKREKLAGFFMNGLIRAYVTVANDVFKAYCGLINVDIPVVNQPVIISNVNVTV